MAALTKSSMRLGPGREFDLIREFVEAGPTERADVRVGSGDDCAVIAGEGIAASTDYSIEGVHFRRDWLTDEEIGYRAAAAALSDLAAMAARPIGVLVALALREADAAAERVHRIGTGARRAAEDAGAVLLGGDLSRSPDTFAISVTVLGEAPAPVTRSGARADDTLWVTGPLGGAAAAVRSWRNGRRPTSAARDAFARPRPRVLEARWLAARGVPHAMIDLSDGLAGDAAHLAAASGVAVALELEGIPVHPAARKVAGGADDALRLALGGGEDYELCFAASADAVGSVADAFRREFGIDLTRVGRIRDGSGIHVLLDDGTLAPLDTGAYTHFEGDAS